MNKLITITPLTNDGQPIRSAEFDISAGLSARQIEAILIKKGLNELNWLARLKALSCSQ